MTIAPLSHPDVASLLEGITHVQRSGADVVPEALAKQVLRSCGIDVPSGALVAGPDDVPGGLVEPLVLKAVSPTLVHKSDAGGVTVGLTRDDLGEAMAQMRARVESAGHHVEGFLIEELAPPGQELVVGAVRTPGVGWVVMLGLGGVFVEVMGDVAFGIAPLRPVDVTAMLNELRGRMLLQGARGSEPVDLRAFTSLVSCLAGPRGLLTQLPAQITEIDLNPVIVSSSGAVAVDARFVVGDSVSGTGRAELPATNGRGSSFEALFDPQTVAVLGASAKGLNGGNRFIRNLKANGFRGRIVPIHPRGDTLEGLRASRSLAEVDGVVDYAYVAIPAPRVTKALAEAEGRVRFAQVVSSGFSETEDGVELERDLIATMGKLGTRVIGPNCLGTHSSHGRLTFIPDAPQRLGDVAVVSQSGGLSVDILRLGDARGLGFHSVTSLGNGSDVLAAELLDYLLDLSEVSTVGLYLESLAEARAVAEVMIRREATKPVILLAGGRTGGGSRAASSHTGALAGNHQLWPALARQAGIELVDSLEDFLNVLLTMATLDSTVTPQGCDVVLFGNGGGASVLAADALGRRGLATPVLPLPAIECLDALGLPPGNGLHNPIDTPAGTLAVKGGAIAEDIVSAVLRYASPALLITHLNVGIIQRNLGETHGDVTGTIIDSIARARDSASHRCHHFLVLKADGKADTREQIACYTRRAQELAIPVFSTFEDAATGAEAVLRHQRRRKVESQPFSPSHQQQR
ncbi:MAG: acetate--CoA ligase family protein [Sciscionella sp.]